MKAGDAWWRMRDAAFRVWVLVVVPYAVCVSGSSLWLITSETHLEDLVGSRVDNSLFHEGCLWRMILLFPLVTREGYAPTPLVIYNFHEKGLGIYNLRRHSPCRRHCCA